MVSHCYQITTEQLNENHEAGIPLGCEAHRPALHFSVLLASLAPRALLLVRLLAISWLLVPKMIALRW